MKIKQPLLLTAIGLLLTACVRDVILELDPIPPRLVLNATLTSSHELSAFLSKSWFLLDSVPLYTVEGAIVRAYVNGHPAGTLQCMDQDTDSLMLKGQYRLPGYYVQPGDHVRLEAEVPDFDPVQAETDIPEQTPILSVDTLRFLNPTIYNYDQTCLRTSVRFNDPAGEPNYYRLIIEKVTEHWKGDSVIVTSSFRPELHYGHNIYDWMELDYEDPAFFSSGSGMMGLSLLDGYYCRGVFTDETFNGSEYTVQAAFAPIQNSYQGDSVTSIVHYDIHLLSISAPYYHYMRLIRIFSINLGDASMNGTIEPADTYTNVANGFGVVTGYQDCTYRFTMPYGDKAPGFTPWDPCTHRNPSQQDSF